MSQASRRSRIRCLVLAILSLFGFLRVPALAQQEWGLQHAGTIFDAFTLDGNEIWTVEDGGRVRHRDASGLWSFQDVPLAKDLLYRVQFLRDGVHGWVVGLNGEYAWTADGGKHWWTVNLHSQIQGDEKFWSVHFIDNRLGWLVEDQGLYRTEDGGATWSAAHLYDAAGTPLTTGALPWNWHLYSLDLIPTSPIPPTGLPTCVGLMSASPGVIFRTTDGDNWQVVFDVHSLCPIPNPPGLIPTCMQGVCAGTPFDAWDIDIRDSLTSPLALMVGGMVHDCGMIFGSTDNGLTWTIEPHECTCPLTMTGCIDCTNDPLYNNDPLVNTETYRWNKYETLYSVSIFEGDGSAIAGGYSGQHLVRDPQTRVWKDRSSYSNDVVHAVGAVITPMFATAANGGTASTGKGLMAGAGGFIRRTVTGGQGWANEVPGDSWRLQGLCFIDNMNGWVVGQRYRIAVSRDAGATWDAPVTPEPSGTSGKNYLSIAMDSTGNIGVAVGEARDNASRPEVRFTRNSSGTNWLTPTSFVDDPSMPWGGSLGKSLREVGWAGGLNFWTAGDAGLIYFSLDGGQTWRQWVPPSGWLSIASFDIKGIAVVNANTVVFVGQRAGVAEAYLYRIPGTPAWTQIPISAGVPLESLSDVDLRLGGSVGYAVGVRGSGPAEQGYILTCNLSTTPNFTLAPNSPVVPAVTVGDSLDSVPVLNRVEIASNGDVWAAGESGRMWRMSGGVWTDPKSQTDAHIRGMSFPPSGDGFAAAQSNGYSAYSVVRLH